MPLKNFKPMHPGEVLLRDFLEPYGIQQKQLVEHFGWTYPRLNEIVNMRRGITAASALCFADAFDTDPEFWLNLQRDWDLWHAKQNHIPIKRLKKCKVRSSEKA